MLVYHKNSKIFYIVTVNLLLFHSTFNLIFDSRTIFRAFSFETLRARRHREKRGRKKIQMGRNRKLKAVGLASR